MPNLSLITCVSLVNFMNFVTTLMAAALFDAICPYSDSNYTTGSVFETNLELAVSDLRSTDSGYGFFNISTGQYPDKVYAIALCRGDVSSIDCGSCVNHTMAELRRRCPDQKDAAGYSSDSYCMVKYSDGEILGKSSNSYAYRWSMENVTDAEGFDQAVLNLMGNLTVMAASGGPLRKYAAESVETSRSDYPRIYGTMQCTPDQSAQQCRSCLRDAVSHLPLCCSGKIGGRVLVPLCNLRYEISQFYDDTLPITPPTSPPTSPAKLPATRPATPSPATSPPTPPSPPPHGKNVLLIVIVTLAVTFTIIIASVVMWMMRRRRKKMTYVSMRARSFESKTKDSNEPGFIEYDFNKVRAATNYFSEENKIGQGGFGSMYKGELDEQSIAVKRLSSDSRQDNSQFRNNVALIAVLQHENLARLLGFSLEGEERLLVYEYFPNSSLDKFLLDPSQRTRLDWDTSSRIIEGVARGLLYLHDNDSHQRIIHCNLKASNVLLDSNMDPKITDFGMTKLFAHGETQRNTIMIEGTIGYMPPEYVRHQHGQISVKLDVFSFGVLVLQIIKGQMCQSFRNEEGVNLLSSAWKSWRQKTTSSKMIDPRLLKRPNLLPEILKSVHVALLCVQESDEARPTMSSVVNMLESVSQITQEPSRPGFYEEPSQTPAVAA